MGDLGWGGNEPLWEQGARLLLDAVVLNDDEMGHLANATADELRDALRLAARRLRTHHAAPHTASQVGQ